MEARSKRKINKKLIIATALIIVAVLTVVVYGAVSYIASGDVYSRSGHEVFMGYLFKLDDLKTLANKLNFTVLHPTYLPRDIELKTILVNEAYSNETLIELTISLLYSDSNILDGIHPGTRYMRAYGREMPYVRIELSKSMAREVSERIKFKIVIHVFFTKRFIEDSQISMNQLISQGCEPASTEIYGPLEKRGVVDVVIDDVYGERACIYISHKTGTISIDENSTIIIPYKGVAVLFNHNNEEYTIVSKYPYEETKKILGSLRPWR